VPNIVKRGEGNTRIVVIKTFAFSLPSQSFLGCHFGFTPFFTTAFLGAAHFYYSWAVLG